jgi:transcriptional regulator GlxA family with amidase domain
MSHRVVVLALDRVIPFDLGIASRVFGACPAIDGQPRYEIVTCSIGGRPVRTADDFTIVVDLDETALATADTVVIATQEPEGDLRDAGILDPEVAAALALMPETTRVVSICTGSFIVAAAGLLDGKAATTHWNYAARFARVFPQVEVRPDVLFVDEGRVLTSAGGAAGVDLCLHLVRLDHGAEVANAAARGIVMPPWRDGGQAQFIEHPVPVATEATTALTREWALGQLRGSLTLDDLAAHAQMSVRTFTRRFRAEVGMSPNQWIIQQRVDRARSLLETTDLPVESIAYETGFGTAALLRRHLRDAIGVSPQAYRRTFRVPVGVL